MKAPSRHISVEQEINFALQLFKDIGLDLNSLDNLQKTSLLFELENIAKAGYNQAMDKMLSLQNEHMDSIQIVVSI